MAFMDFAKKHSIEELASIVGCHPTTMRKYKNGSPMPSDTLVKIADYYKTSTDVILGRHVPVDLIHPEPYPDRPPISYAISEEQMQQANQLKTTQQILETLRKNNSDLRGEKEKLEDEVNVLRETIEKSKQTSETMPVNDHQMDALVHTIESLEKRLNIIHYLSEEK